MVGKHGGTRALSICAFQQFLEIVSIEDVVAQHQCTGGTVQKGFANQKCLCQTVRAGLYGVFQRQPPLTAIAQQLFKTRRVLRRADDQNLANTRQHQRAQRVINHGLVIHRQQLLADRQGCGMQARARAACQNNAFALLGHGI